MLWRSMQQVVDQDLAVHLYNAFALKRRDLDARTAQGLTMKLVSVQNLCRDQKKAVATPLPYSLFLGFL